MINVQAGKRKVAQTAQDSDKAPVHSVASSRTPHDAVHFAVARLIQDDADVDANKANAIKSGGGDSRKAQAAGRVLGSQDLAAKRSKKEPSARGCSGYMLFCNANRQGFGSSSQDNTMIGSPPWHLPTQQANLPGTVLKYLGSDHLQKITQARKRLGTCKFAS